jgi:hypothetical protein
MLQHNQSGGWTQDQDDLLRLLVDQTTPLEVICSRLNRTVDEVRRRGNVIGLPLKWYQRISRGEVAISN